jgi:hypothetical protein
MNRLVRNTLLALGLVVVTQLAVAQDSAVQIRDHEVVFAPMSRPFIDRFFDSLRAQSPFNPEPLVVPPPVDVATSGVWAGAQTEAQTDISDVTLRFRPSAAARLERAQSASNEKLPLLADEFDLSLSWTREGLRIVHPYAESRVARGGVLVPVSQYQRSPARTEYFSAFRDAGMYIAVTSMIQAELERAWAIFICPRVAGISRVKPGVTPRRELHPSPYELSEVKMVWSGSMRAAIPMGSKKEKVAIDLSVSSGLPKAFVTNDEVTAVSPTLNLTYQPTSEFAFVRYPQEGALQHGLLFSVIMQNAAGYERTKRFAHVGYVQRMDEPSPVTVILRDQVASRDEGSCYIVAAQSSIWSEYQKKEAPVAQVAHP